MLFKYGLIPVLSMTSSNSESQFTFSGEAPVRWEGEKRGALTTFFSSAVSESVDVRVYSSP